MKVGWLTQQNSKTAVFRITHIGPVLVVLAAFCWGLSGGIGAVLIDRGWSAPITAFYRCAVGLLIFLVWLGASRRYGGLTNPKVWLWSGLAGLGIAGNFGFYFLSISQGSVAVAATLMYCAPVFVFLVAFGCGLERFTYTKGLAIGLVMVGIVLLTGIYDVNASAITSLGVAAGLLAGVSYAAFIFGFKNAAPMAGPPLVLSIAFSVSTVALLSTSDLDQAAATITSNDWPLFLVLGILGAGLSFIFYYVGLRQTAPTVASLVAMVEPVTASTFGLLVLEQTLTGLEGLGMALILVTVTALSMSSSEN